MLDQIASKTCRKMKMVNGVGKRGKTQNDIKPFQNINKNPHSSLDASPLQKETPA